MTIHLSIPLWLPAACGVLGLFAPRAVTRGLALLGALGALGYAVALTIDHKSGGGLQYITDDQWIRALGIHYKLGVDGLNLFLILLTTILFTASTLWALGQEWDRERSFWLHMGIGQTAVLGALMAQDLALFVAFFDLMLIPFFFLTGMWGDAETRVPAVTKLVIYTLVGSLLMLTAAIATAVIASSNSGNDLTFAFTGDHSLAASFAQAPLGKGTQEWIFLCFAAAFLVKMPAFPFHGWMPDGYRAMPMPALAVFSGVLSKVAAYGFLRIALPFFPDAAVHFQTLMLIVALASILYGSLLAFSTTNSRLILGYSSIAQLGFITLGIFALNDQGGQGALLQAFNHGLVVAPAFFIVWLLAARSGGSEDIRDMGGLAFRAPVLAAMFLIVALANLAMPGSSNFVGEFLILLGVFKAKLAIAIIASTGVALASVYTLRLFIRTMHNRTGQRTDSREISLRDAIILVPLVAAIVAIAFDPQVALKHSEPTVKKQVAAAPAGATPPAAGAQTASTQSAAQQAAAAQAAAAQAGAPQGGAAPAATAAPTTGGTP